MKTHAVGPFGNRIKWALAGGALGAGLGLGAALLMASTGGMPISETGLLIPFGGLAGLVIGWLTGK